MDRWTESPKHTYSPVPGFPREKVVCVDSYLATPWDRHTQHPQTLPGGDAGHEVGADTSRPCVGSDHRDTGMAHLPAGTVA